MAKTIVVEVHAGCPTHSTARSCAAHEVLRARRRERGEDGRRGAIVECRPLSPAQALRADARGAGGDDHLALRGSGEQP